MNKKLMFASVYSNFTHNKHHINAHDCMFKYHIISSFAYIFYICALGKIKSHAEISSTFKTV